MVMAQHPSKGTVNGWEGWGTHALALGHVRVQMIAMKQREDRLKHSGLRHMSSQADKRDQVLWKARLVSLRGWGRCSAHSNTG
jgi:hypothetical protein